jgi:histidyl-tRNA synthetase
MLTLQSAMVDAGLKVHCHMGEGSMKNQFKRADKSAAKVAVIIAEDEATKGVAKVKVLLRGVEQLDKDTVSQNDVPNTVTNLLKSL